MTALLVIVTVSTLALAWHDLLRLHCACCHRGYAVFRIRGRVGSVRACWRCRRTHRRRAALRGGR